MKMNFQNIFLGALIIAVIGAIIVFSNYKSSSSNGAGLVKISMWGDVQPDKGLSAAIAGFNQSHQKTHNISYSYIKPEDFESKLIESIADGKAPDTVLISNTKILRLENKLVSIPYASIPLSKFNDTYIEAAKAFLGPKGVIGFPLLIDPIVFYWNHDMFTNASIINGPKYWDDIISIEPQLTKRGVVTGTFDASAIALGEYENITHAKDIIATLLIQTGIPIIERDSTGKTVASLKSTVRTTGEPPIDSALRFYMDFANPLKTLYSWNRTQPASLDAFLADKLAMYIGRSSDYKFIQEKNPHLAFEVGQVPQMRGTSAEATYAEVLGVSILKASKQQQGAMSVLSALASDSNFINMWSKASLLPPARKDLLSKQQSDLIMPVFYNAAIRSKTWLDPNEEKTSSSFGQAINGLSSGRFQVPSSAANFLEQELGTILNSLPQ